MATKKSQQIAIWVIAIALIIGTLGSFLVLILAPQNDVSDRARLEQLMSEYQEQVAEQDSELSSKYYGELSGYQSRVSAFDAASVTELKTEDLKEGDGDELTNESMFSAYYIGWNPSGTVFDSSFNETSDGLKSPHQAAPGMVIPGWTEGVAGMKVGGVREITIPAEQAYGEAGSGENIPPNTPLKFIIMVIPTPDQIEPSEELLRLNQRVGM